MKLIVGLGNPGKEYAKTRHNVGFMVLDAVASKYGLSFSDNKFNGLSCITKIGDEKVMLLKPQKFMNLSGEVIKEYSSYYKIDIDDILIIHDDLDIELGNFKIKPKGSSGGHNGLKNIEFMMNSIDYKRIKIGIFANNKIDTKDFVLGNFNKIEKEIIDKVIEKIVLVVEEYPIITFENLMNKYN